MRSRRRPNPRRQEAAYAAPLPHPSWLPLAEGRRVTAQEFWQRLGL